MLMMLMATARAEDLSTFAFSQRPGAALPWDVPLLDEGGRVLSLRQVSSGLPVVLALGYLHCPNLCGVVREDALSALSRSGLRAGRDYALAIVTIDPAETPADAARARAESLARYDASAAYWLTGPPAGLRALQDAAGLHVRSDPALKQFLHPAGLVVATPAGVVSSYVLGVGYEPADLVAAIARARDGGIGWAAPVLLLCFHFDAASGRYTLAVAKVVRLAAGLTALALGAALLRAHRGRPA